MSRDLKITIRPECSKVAALMVSKARAGYSAGYTETTDTGHSHGGRRGFNLGVNASHVVPRASTETATKCFTSLHTKRNPQDGRFSKDVNTFTSVNIVLTPPHPPQTIAVRQARNA